MRLCAELADLAMQLARAAAARTLADWAGPEETPAAEPLLAETPEPPLTQPAQPPADREPAPHTTPAPRRPATPAPPKPTDPAVLFTRLAATVRDCIALEARLAAGAAEAPTGRMRRADPRRAPLGEILRTTTENHPDRADLLRQATIRLDAQLAADPDQTIEPGHILIDLCDALGIELDLATIPDKYLFALTETIDQDDDTPDPRATSPP